MSHVFSHVLWISWGCQAGSILHFHNLAVGLGFNPIWICEHMISRCGISLKKTQVFVGCILGTPRVMSIEWCFCIIDSLSSSFFLTPGLSRRWRWWGRGWGRLWHCNAKAHAWDQGDQVTLWKSSGKSHLLSPGTCHRSWACIENKD